MLLLHCTSRLRAPQPPRRRKLAGVVEGVEEPGGGPGSGSGSAAAPLSAPLMADVILEQHREGRVQECASEECDRGVRV